MVIPRMILLTATLLLSLAHAQARIGETEAEITARYGNGKRDEGYRGASIIPVASVMRYEKDGITIQVAFAGETSVAEAYWKTNGMGLSGTELGALLIANQGRASWSSTTTLGSRVEYTRDDQLETATYDHNTQVLDLRAVKKSEKPLSGF